MIPTVPVLAVGQLELDVLRLARGHAEDRHLDLLQHPAGSELDDVVALRLSTLLDEVDHDRVARLRRTVGRRELGDREPQCLELLVDELGRDVCAGVRNLEPFPVGDLDLRLDVDGRR